MEKVEAKGRDNRTRASRLSNWRRNFILTNTYRGEEDLKSRRLLVYLKGRSKFGFKTGE